MHVSNQVRGLPVYLQIVLAHVSYNIDERTCTEHKVIVLGRLQDFNIITVNRYGQDVGCRTVQAAELGEFKPRLIALHTALIDLHLAHDHLVTGVRQQYSIAVISLVIGFKQLGSWCESCFQVFFSRTGRREFQRLHQGTCIFDNGLTGECLSIYERLACEVGFIIVLAGCHQQGCRQDRNIFKQLLHFLLLFNGWIDS